MFILRQKSRSKVNYSLYSDVITGVHGWMIGSEWWKICCTHTNVVVKSRTSVQVAQSVIRDYSWHTLSECEGTCSFTCIAKSEVIHPTVTSAFSRTPIIFSFIWLMLEGVIHPIPSSSSSATSRSNKYKCLITLYNNLASIQVN